MIKVDFDVALKLAKQVKIPDQKSAGSLIPFVLYPEQERILKEFCQKPRVCVLKGRQIGISTLALYYALLFASCNKGIRVALIANTHKVSQSLLSKISKMAKSLQVKHLKIKNTMSFKNGSTIDCVTAGAQSGSAGRSDTYSLIIGSEVAYWERGEEAYAGILPTLTMDGQIIMESTATSAGVVFRNIWQSKQFTQIFTGFESHPNYVAPETEITDEDYFCAQQKYGFTSRKHAAWWFKKLEETNNDEIRVLREYPITPDHCWSAAEGRWVPKDIPIKMYRNDPLYSEIHIYNNYDPSHTYVAAVDTSAGGGGDDACIVIWDTNTYEIAASFCANNMLVPMVALNAAQLQKLFNPTIWYVEINNLGPYMNSELQKHGIQTKIFTTDYASKYQGMIWARDRIMNYDLYADENLQRNVQKCIITHTKVGLLSFNNDKDFLMTIGFIGNHEKEWLSIRDTPKPIQRSPNAFNAEDILNQRNNYGRWMR